MAPWLLKAFSGERPKISPFLLPSNGAQSAINVRLDDGTLSPLRAPEFISSFASYPGNYQSLYRYQSTWLGWNGFVKAVPGPVDQDRLYIAGDGVPKMRDGATTYNLAVPFPTGALTATLSGTATDPTSLPETRIYVYTYVTSYGEESEPCPASNAVVWQPGMTVTLSGFASPPTGRAITTQRIYRTQTGSAGTDLYFIVERPAASSNYVDLIADDAFAEVLPSRAYNAPLATLAGLVGMPNGMMAAFDSATKRDIWFCEPFLPHAWPEAYMLTVDFDIVALAAIGTTLIILTAGQPYIAIGTSPSSMQMMKVESNLPCINAFSVVDLGYSIAYASHEGLVLAGAAGSFSVITHDLFNRTDWQRLNPATISAGQLSGRYVASYNTVAPDGSPLQGSLVLDLSGNAPALDRSDAVAQAFFYSLGEGALYYLKSTGDIERFDPPSGPPMNYYWKSRLNIETDYCNYGCLLIESDEAPTDLEVANINAARAAATTANAALLANPLGSEIDGDPVNTFALAGDGLRVLPSLSVAVTVGVYADGNKIASINSVGRMVRLPSGFRARKWEIDVFGTMRVLSISLAKTVDELRAIGNE